MGRGLIHPNNDVRKIRDIDLWSHGDDVVYVVLFALIGWFIEFRMGDQNLFGRCLALSAFMVLLKRGISTFPGELLCPSGSGWNIVIDHPSMGGVLILNPSMDWCYAISSSCYLPIK